MQSTAFPPFQLTPEGTAILTQILAGTAKELRFTKLELSLGGKFANQLSAIDQPTIDQNWARIDFLLTPVVDNIILADQASLYATIPDDPAQQEVLYAQSKSATAFQIDASFPQRIPVYAQVGNARDVSVIIGGGGTEVAQVFALFTSHANDPDAHMPHKHEIAQVKGLEDAISNVSQSVENTNVTIQNVIVQGVEKLAKSRSIDGVDFDGSRDITRFGVSNTASGSSGKTVAVSGFNLTSGAEVRVKFANTNTAAGPTLNVNGTGPKPIYSNGVRVIEATGLFQAGAVYAFVYDGENYNIQVAANIYSGGWGEFVRNAVDLDVLSGIGCSM